jgi:hypothetical protein
MTGPADDDALLARLAATLRGAQDPPADVAELARLSFGLRDLDAQLAELVADSAVDVPVGVRSATGAARLLTFAGEQAEVELQVTSAGDGWAVLGQVVPPGPALVRAEPAAPGVAAVAADADDLGRFALDLSAGGPWRFVGTRDGSTLLATDWVLLR